MSDIHLLIGGLFNILLPMLGFAGAIVMVRYPNNYRDCVMKQYNLTAAQYEKQDKEQLRFWIRVLQANIYCLSISYFFFIYKANMAWWRIFNLVFYTFVLISFIVCGIMAVADVGTSKCADTAYAKMNVLMGTVEVGCGAAILILHILFSLCYKSSGKLPECCVKMDGDARKKAGRVDSQGNEVEMQAR